VLLLGGRRTDEWGPYLAIGSVLSSFLFGLLAFGQLLGLQQRAVDQHLFTFLPVNGLQIDAGLLFDPLSATFVLLITGVGTLIHIYSLGYMELDPRRRLFFAYLNLFVAAMLLLVLGDSFLPCTSAGRVSAWPPTCSSPSGSTSPPRPPPQEGLHRQPRRRRRPALAIFVMFAALGTTSFAGVFSQAELLGAGTATAIGLLLLLGACGKSGQFPLQTWLPDAMEGPTPVSALIHAATMVTAGVYLIARSTPIYDVTDTARTAVVIIGAITLMIGASSAAPTTTSRRCWPTRRSARSATCSSPSASPGAGRSRSCTCSRTASSRPRCSCRPARSCTG
jgi:NADH-quinone oxidoreductase subunit L